MKGTKAVNSQHPTPNTALGLGLGSWERNLERLNMKPRHSAAAAALAMGGVILGGAG